MAELIPKRIARLKTRKQELLGKINELLHGELTVRNRMHKVDMLNVQVLNIVAKIKELKGMT